MSKFQDLTGQSFGYLTVERQLPKKSGKNRWLCKCKCGKYATPTTHRLLSGATQSCGCIRHSPDHETYTHGKSGERIYNIWCGIKKRCYNENDSSYSRYGGKGIVMCNEWKHDFMSFYSWAQSHGYDDTLSIDRIDNSQGYFPDNCRWISMSDQARNKKRTIYITHNGEKKPLSEWCRTYDFSYHVAIQRYENHVKQGHDPITLDMLFFRGNCSCRRLKQSTKNGEIVKVWDSITSAVNAGYSRSGIYRCLTGHFRSSGGYVWQYAD